MACLAHCRRKFFDLHAAGGHPVAQEGLRRIGELYAVETLGRDGNVADRLTLRQQHAMPKLSALGHRNGLFTGSERAGCRAAAIQSLLATAKLNGLEPYAWLKDMLEKLPAWPYSRIDELLPIRTVATV